MLRAPLCALKQCLGAEHWGAWSRGQANEAGILCCWGGTAGTNSLPAGAQEGGGLGGAELFGGEVAGLCQGLSSRGCTGAGADGWMGWGPCCWGVSCARGQRKQSCRCRGGASTAGGGELCSSTCVPRGVQVLWGTARLSLEQAGLSGTACLLPALGGCRGGSRGRCEAVPCSRSRCRRSEMSSTRSSPKPLTRCSRRRASRTCSWSAS